MRGRSTALLFALLATACGTSGASPAPAPSDASTSANDDAAEGSADAGPNPHDVYPADHPPIPAMTNFGGRVLANARVVTVTFAGLDSALRDYVRDFDAKIGTTTYWSIALDGYGIGPTIAGGDAELPDTLSGTTLADPDLAKYIAAQIESGALPPASDDTVYMVYLPVAATVTLDDVPSCQSFYGYHASGGIPASGDAGAHRFVYAAIAQCVAKIANATAQDEMNEMTETAAHELAEVVTDPDVNVAGVDGTYYLVGNDAWASTRIGGEVGDLCDNVSRVTEGIWSVPRIWNAKSAKASLDPCQPAPSAVYYAAVPHTVNPAKTSSGGPKSDGYIIAKKGETTNIEVDVFSTAPLPAPLTLVATRSRFATADTDPTIVSEVAKGVTMTWSQPTARNGDKVTLAIAVDSTAASTPSGTRFTIRAVESKSDYTNWPVILRIP